MKIGMIGVGKIGGILAGRYAAAGHEVTISNSRGADSLTDLASGLGAHAGSIVEAVYGADVVFISIPQMNIPTLPADLFSKAGDDLVIVDTGNYMPFRDPPIAEIEGGEAESLWVSRKLGRPVIKAYNSIIAESLRDEGRPAGTPGRVALPVAGDDARAKRIVMDLVDLSGFDPFDAGPLAESWRQQPGTAAYCTDLTLAELPHALAAANRSAAPAIRDAFTKELLDGWETAKPGDRVKIIRSYQGGNGSSQF
ncbi:NADPH-dependent F420 reductase [Sphingobium mellinum]|uniref:NADPH-dependent F420 reductase n=1 Tax=Sphingobium mellinum TaxID=1387166 RepID=UPI0030EF4AE9